MSKKEDREKAYKEFQEWQDRTNKVIDSVKLQKTRLDNSQPMMIPKGYVIAGIITIIALVIASFPILMFGIAIGAFLYAKASNSWRL